MLKLSRRNWNNVLIFAVLALMFALYGIPQRLAEYNAPLSVQRLIPADAQLLMIALGNQRLVQAGSQWRLQPAAPGVDPLKLAVAWQHSLLTPVEVTDNSSRIPVAQASVQLAGQTAPLIWLLYPGQEVDQYLLQQAGQRQFYQLSAQQATQLFLLDSME